MNRGEILKLVTQERFENALNVAIGTQMEEARRSFMLLTARYRSDSELCAALSKAFTALRDESPSDHIERVRRIGIRLSQENTEESKRASISYLEWSAWNGDTAHDHLWLGSTLVQIGECDRAMPFLEKALKLRGDTIDYHWMGVALTRMGKKEEALRSFAAAVDKGGGADDCHCAGCLLTDLKRPQEAIPYFEEAVRLRGQPLDHHWLGATLAGLDRWAEALPYLEHAVDGGSHATDYEWLVAALYRLGRKSEAYSRFTQARDRGMTLAGVGQITLELQRWCGTTAYGCKRRDRGWTI